MTPENESKLRRMIKRHEGYRSKVYIDTVGIKTAGIGHALQGPIAAAYHEGQQIDPAIIGAWFEEDFQKAKEDFEDMAFDLDDVRSAVLIDMIFNLGMGSAKRETGLLGFKNTLAAIREQAWERAAKGMLASKWARQVKGRADELAAMMRTGQWQK